MSEIEALRAEVAKLRKEVARLSADRVQYVYPQQLVSYPAWQPAYTPQYLYYYGYPPQLPQYPYYSQAYQGGNQQ